MPAVDPRTGELIADGDVDALATALVMIRAEINRLRLYEHEICADLARLARGTEKTQRVRGEKRRVKIVAADDAWDQAALKRLWGRYTADLSEKYLKIDRIAVNRIEFNKMAAEHGPARFEEFKEELLAANQGPRGQPSVIVEE